MELSSSPFSPLFSFSFPSCWCITSKRVIDRTIFPSLFFFCSSSFFISLLHRMRQQHTLSHESEKNVSPFFLFVALFFFFPCPGPGSRSRLRPAPTIVSSPPTPFSFKGLPKQVLQIHDEPSSFQVFPLEGKTRKFFSLSFKSIFFPSPSPGNGKEGR